MPQQLVLCLLLLSISIDSVYNTPAEQKKGPKSLSEEPHTTANGEHNVHYDHEAFLGKEEAAEFDKLPLKESKRRLRIICDKIDTDNDGLLSTDELKEWVEHVSHRAIVDNTKQYFDGYDKDNDGKISWEEYKKSAFGPTPDLDAIYDRQRGLTYKEAIKRNQRRFKACDLNNNGALDDDKELMSFIHPEEFKHTQDIHIDETFSDMDKNKDGSISLEEYIDDVWPQHERDGDEEPEWVQTEREHFKKHRDSNGDNKLNKKELKDWISPEGYSAAQAEAAHLIHHADSDKDKKLSISEVLDNHSLFVGSHATEFGAYLERHDEF